MHCFHGKINWGHINYLLYRGGLYLDESVMGSSTVQQPINYLIYNFILNQLHP